MSMRRFIISGAVMVPIYIVFRLLAHATGDEAFVFVLGWIAATLATIIDDALSKQETA